MAVLRDRRVAAGVVTALAVLAMTLAFGFDGFVAANRMAELLFWALVVYGVLRFCVRVLG
ncbi:hypothetical protein [Halococcus agarilyticus]|uniref:hypothetical protein n=1 Tax=Halococcus agarilyticus TaxID=1232219 RepID=UPI000677F05A|nr:hypothetical protein [Halococcus agarilyticus]